MGSKRGRFLIRQPRIKKDIDLLEHHHSSPDIDESHHPHGSFHHHHHHLIGSGYSSVLTVPPKIERHSSEPGPQLSCLSPLSSTSGTLGTSSFISSTSPHLLSVPQPSYLVKQHSHPLLPSQSHSPPTTTLSLQRQLSHPITQSSSLLSSPSVSLHTHLSTESIITSGLHSSLVQFGGVTVIKTEDMMGSGSSGISSKTASPTVVVVTDPLSNITSEPTIPSIRIKTEELQRSISTPMAITRELSIENARSSHCPVVRPGPALGCNFCWNTIDTHGRILRRKTKYHCPECQTNLCIVPCFQEFHERQSNDSNNMTSGSGGGGGGSGNTHSGNSSSNTGSTNNDSKTTLRHYPKTGSL